ncbi:MAG: efflux RND transporter periplasmic adaptor subunit [Terriglobales bacterium]
MKRRWIMVGAGLAIILIAVVAVVAAGERNAVSSKQEIPGAVVKRGDLDMKVYATAELQASRNMTLSAPAIGGGALQITHLSKTGTVVKKGDVVIEFDPGEQHYKLEQSRSELLQAEQEIAKAKADAAVQTAQDKVALLKAHYNVRRAELDVQQNELKSTIDAQKNLLARDEAKRALVQLEQDIKSHTVSGQATIALAQEKSNKAKLSMDQAQQNIEKMRVTSPIDGLVSINRNEGDGEIEFSGMPMPSFREGDQVYPGTAIAQVIDANEMEAVAKVGEQDRDNIRIGQRVEIRLDALPGHTLQGTVKTLAGMSSRRFWEDDTGGRFDVFVALIDKGARLRPGLTAQIVFGGDPLKNVLCLPRQALVLKDGKHLLYAKNGSNYEPREVKILSENESRAAIEGVSAGTEVALVDPTAPAKASSAGGAAGDAGGGTP